MRALPLKFLAAGAAAAVAGFMLLRLRARHSTIVASRSEVPIDSASASCPLLTCDSAAAEEKMRRGARMRGEPCVLDVAITNVAEYRRGGCDMIVQDFIEAGASDWAVNALRCILIARGADQAFRCWQVVTSRCSFLTVLAEPKRNWSTTKR
jgi:hypothetical protein